MTAAEPLLDVSGLRVHLPADRGLVRAIDGLDLEIPDGRITAIVGPNASGKSTLLRGLARLMRPEAGRVTLDGRDARIATVARSPPFRGCKNCRSRVRPRARPHHRTRPRHVATGEAPDPARFSRPPPRAGSTWHAC